MNISRWQAKRENQTDVPTHETGLAEGAGKELADILALNVRTEINFGLFSDGCTALSWAAQDSSFLAQNWDVSLFNRPKPNQCELD